MKKFLNPVRNQRFLNWVKVLLIFTLIFSWVFSAWPQIRFAGSPTSLSFPSGVEGVQAAGGWLTGWDFRRAIIINHLKVDADLTNFPVMVRLTAANFNFANSRDDGFDIRFTEANGTTTLAFERERHISTLGAEIAEYWVKIPSVSADVDTIFFIYYGNAGASDGANPTAVWDVNTVARWGLQENPNDANPAFKDSTLNNNHGTDHGAMTSADSVGGKIGKALDFDGLADGTGDFVDTLLNPGTELGQTLTIESWVFPHAQINHDGIWGMHAVGAFDGMGLQWHGGQWNVFFGDGTAWHGKGIGSLTLNTWTHIVGVIKGGTGGYIRVYINGVEHTPQTNISTAIAHTAHFDIGRGHTATNRHFDGIIDEVRASNTERSAAWIKASFNSGNNTLLVFPPPNVAGWAWSSTIGWISFNGRNCDPDGDGGSDGAPGCPPTGTAIPVYGVNIEAEGNMTGYAWSANIGWIDFDPPAPFPTGAGTVATSSRIDTTTGEFSGWARALAHGHGWDGWISMRGETTEVPPTEYGVWLDTAPTPNEFRGWAWGDDVVGWISFNDKTYVGPGPADFQVTTDFDINAPPSAVPLTPAADHCVAPQRYIFSWTFDDPGDTQLRYRLQVATHTNFAAGPLKIDKTVTSSAPSSAPLDFFEWNILHHWRVMVWDSHNVASAWSTTYSFTTQVHASPWPDFTWSPTRPVVGEIVNFEDISACFGLGGATATCTAWSWDFNNDGIIDSTSTNPTTTFAASGIHTVALGVTDPTGFSCTSTKAVGIDADPPEWIEIPPIIWLRDERFAFIYRPALASLVWAREFWADAVGAVDGFRARIIDFVNNL